MKEVNEWLSIGCSSEDEDMEEVRGIGTCEIEMKVVGRLHKPRHFFSYQVHKGQVIVLGGCLTSGEPLRSTELIDCNGAREEQVSVTMNKTVFPEMIKKRHMHQSLILGGRYLYVFFGMSSETLLTRSIECLDL